LSDLFSAVMHFFLASSYTKLLACHTGEGKTNICLNMDQYNFKSHYVNDSNIDGHIKKKS